MANIAPQGAGTIRAHLDHLAAHGEDSLLAIALEWLRTAGIPVPEGVVRHAGPRGGEDRAGPGAHG